MTKTLYLQQEESADNTVCAFQEVSAVVYTTVDFKPLHKPSEIYENLRVANKQQGHGVSERAGAVEYSTLALRHHP